MKLFDVGIVGAVAELIEFFLYTFDDLRFEQSTVVEQLLHCHVGDDAPRLAFDDAFDDVLNVVATSWYNPASRNVDLAIGVSSKQYSMSKKRIVITNVKTLQTNAEAKVALVVEAADVSLRPPVVR